MSVSGAEWLLTGIAEAKKVPGFADWGKYGRDGLREGPKPDQRQEKYRCACTQAVHHVTCDHVLGSKAFPVSQGWEVEWNIDKKFTQGGPVGAGSPEP